MRRLEALLPAYLQRQRWFGGKARNIVRARIADSVLFDDKRSALLWVSVDYVEGESDTWLLCLAMSFGEAAGQLREAAPHQILATAGSAMLTGVLHEGLLRNTPSALLEILANGDELRTRNGTVVGLPSVILPSLRGPQPLTARASTAEQSNTSAILGDRLILKLFRRQQPGQNPDVEIGRFLTETAGFSNAPAFGGSIEVRREGDEPAALVLAPGPRAERRRRLAVDARGTRPLLREHRLGEVSRRCQPPPKRTPSRQKRATHAGLYLDAAAILGRRTAELHLALASGRDAAFAPHVPGARRPGSDARPSDRACRRGLRRC